MQKDKDTDKANLFLLVIPEKYEPIIFNTYHDSLLAGHQGPYRTAMTIRQKFFIHNLMNKVKRYIEACHTCLKTKPKYMENRPIYGRIPVDYAPIQDLSIDIKMMPQAFGGYIMKHLWDKGQMWPLFATTAAYAMNTFTSEALSSLSPFQLIFLRDPPDLTILSFPKIDTIPVKRREYYNLLLARAQLVGNMLLEWRTKQALECESKAKKFRNEEIFQAIKWYIYWHRMLQHCK